MTKIDIVEGTLKAHKEVAETGLNRIAIIQNICRHATAYIKGGVEMSDEFKTNFIAMFSQEDLNDDMYAIKAIHEMMMKLKERGLVEYEVELG